MDNPTYLIAGISGIIILAAILLPWVVGRKMTTPEKPASQQPAQPKPQPQPTGPSYQAPLPVQPQQAQPPMPTPTPPPLGTLAHTLFMQQQERAQQEAAVQREKDEAARGAQALLQYNRANPHAVGRQVGADPTIQAEIRQRLLSVSSQPARQLRVGDIFDLVYREKKMDDYITLKTLEFRTTPRWLAFAAGIVEGLKPWLSSEGFQVGLSPYNHSYTETGYRSSDSGHGWHEYTEETVYVTRQDITISW